jgi:hypothetical protein
MLILNLWLLSNERENAFISRYKSKLANFDLRPNDRGQRIQPSKEKPTHKTPVEYLKIQILVIWLSEGTESF